MLFPCLLAAQSGADVRTERFPLPVDGPLPVFRLSSPFVIATSVRVMVDSMPWHAFRYDPASGSVDFLRPPEAGAAAAVVTYRVLPVQLKPSYSRRSIVFRSDSSGTVRPGVVRTSDAGLFTGMFGPELSRSGSISRGFLIGSNRDVTVNSGFRLQLAGKLSDEVDIVAALTDENTPIQPQGNTQTLQELDNIFVQITAPAVSATLGDFVHTASSGGLFSVNRKLQGATVTGDLRSLQDGSTVTITGASTRGKYHSNAIAGTEGSQGPYRLTGRNNERNIIVIAGSERVFVDGAAMVRGDNNDYTIDYAAGEIVFSARRLITGASRIVVDFEYSDRQYTRNAAGVSARTNLTRDASFQFHYYREGDDPDAPIDLLLSDTDRALLASSGDRSPSRSGVTEVGTDTLGNGKGHYVAVDSTISGSAVRFYRYDPFTPSSRYDVTFSNVGAGQGDYVREGVGRYRYAGPNGGPYAPVVLLPAAQLQQYLSMSGTVSLGSSLSLETEYSASDIDRNRASDLDDDDNAGSAYRFRLRYAPEKLMLGGTNVGRLDAVVSQRFRDGRFTAPDRLDETEFGRKWSTDSMSMSGTAAELLREGSLQYTPMEDVLLRGGIGTMDRSGEFSSRRYEGGFDVRRTGFPFFSYSVEQIDADEAAGGTESRWFRQKGSAEHGIAFLTTALRFENEDRNVSRSGGDSLWSPSYAFTAYAPKVGMTAWSLIDASAEYEWRQDRAVLGGRMEEQSVAETRNLSMALRETGNFSLQTVLTFRERRYARNFQSANTDQQTTLIKTQSRYRPFDQGVDLDLLYDVATQRTATLERVFFKVRRGEGQYVWMDANQNGIVDVTDEAEFRPDRYEGEYVVIVVNSETLTPVVNLRSSARLRILPERFLGAPVRWWTRALASLSTETYVRIEERSSAEPSRIYRLDLAAFMDPVTTLYGVQFVQQDLFLFENGRDGSVRLRFNQRKGMSRYFGGTERNYARERSVRTRWQMTADISNQTDLAFRDDHAASLSPLNPSRRIASVTAATDLSYRPERNIELGIRLESGRSEDRVAPAAMAADLNLQALRLVIGSPGTGQARFEISREELLLGRLPSPAYIVPFELTQGRDPGKQFLWSLSADHRPGTNVVISVSYLGRTAPGPSVVHNGKAEIRAFF